MASVALVAMPGLVADDAMRAGATARVETPVRPSRALDRRAARGLTAEALEELRQRHALLELDGAVGHGADSLVRSPQHRRQLAHKVSLAESRF